MKHILEYVAVQLRRAMSFRVLFIILGIALIQTLSVVGFMNENAHVFYLLVISIDSMAFFSVMMLPAASFSDTFAQEWESHEAFLYMIRSGVVPYCVSKLIAAALVGFFCVFLGFGLTMLIFRGMGYAWFIPGIGGGGTAYEPMMEQGKIVAGYLLTLTDLSFSGALVAVLGMVVSMFVPNAFAAIASPLILVFTMNILFNLLRLPAQINPMTLMDIMSGELTSISAIVEKAALCFAAMGILGTLGVREIRRRLADD